MPHQSSCDFLFVAPTPFYANRGCHMRIRGEAEALQRKGHKVLVLTYKEGDNVLGLNIKRSLLSFGKYGKGVSATWKNIPNGIFLFLSVLHETIYQQPKVIYGHLFEGAAIGIVVKYLAIIFSFFKYKPILVLDAQGSLVGEMGSYGMYKKGTFLAAFFLFWEKFILYFSDFIFTSSVQCAEKLKRTSPKSNPINLPDGISIFLPKISESLIRHYYGNNGKNKALAKITDFFSKAQLSLIEEWITQKKIIILYTGSYSSAKGFPAFVENCLPRLLKDNDLRILCGGGNYADIPQLAKLIKDYPQKIISLGELSPKNLLYFSLLGSIGIDCKPPKTSESSGKILNYMAVGLPVVCFRQKNNQFFLIEGGLFASDYPEFTQNIIKLSDNSLLIAEMGEKNLKRAWGKFTWDLQMEKMLSILNNSNK
ncbi:MAG: glycosyltransferase [Candidatus Moraniibacteriota bacterium]